MNAEERKTLKTQGYLREYEHAGDAVGMTEEEKQMLDARLDMAFAVRRLREAMSLSQQELAARLKTSQPRVAKIEQAAPDVSFDQILRAYMAVGGRVLVKELDAPVAGKNGAKVSKRAKSVMQIGIGGRRKETKTR